MSVDIKFKNKKYGLCSICEKNDKFSKDHIPPKCCGNKGKFIYTRLTKKNNGRENYIAQNGITFSFICDNCNNRMGALYDEELARFRQLILDLSEKKSSNIKVDLLKILKCVLGHFLASYQRGNSELQRMMRKLYLDELNVEKEFYENYSLYCYLYPFENKIFILNEYLVKDVSKTKNNDDGFYSSLYFYPFAFIITKKDRFGSHANLTNSILNNAPFIVTGKDWYDENNNLKSDIWPADIVNYKFLLIGDSADSSVIAVDKNVKVLD